MKKHFFSLIFLAFSTLLVAQNTVKGNVTDSKNAPLVGASVTLEDANLGVLTDANGHFELVVSDKFKDSPLVFSHVGFDSKLEFMAKDKASLSVKLVEGLTLDELVITTNGVGISCRYPGCCRTICVMTQCFSEVAWALTPLTTEAITANEEIPKKLTINSLYAESKSNQLDLNLTSYKTAPTQMTVVNMNGQVVFQQLTTLLEGQNNVALSAGQLSAGLYVLSVQQGQEQAIRKFVIAN